MSAHYRKLSIVSSLFVVAGLFLMFTSAFFGTALADTWLSMQGGAVETSAYDRIADTYIRNFVIIGSIMFGAGILMGILT
ncbi:MAG TPA: hypothetical protein VK945_13575, partial [Planococcus sp. (in: firmicutes)]|nr:hypothetical protein [Planococcus sp. (in: firmicutes)]